MYYFYNFFSSHILLSIIVDYKYIIIEYKKQTSGKYAFNIPLNFKSFQFTLMNHKFTLITYLYNKYFVLITSSLKFINNFKHTAMLIYYLLFSDQ